MTDQLNEKISSLVDGELNDVDSQQTVSILVGDKEKSCCWERYHLISDTIKRNLPRVVDCQLASRVMAELENEPTVLAPHSHKPSSLSRRMAGLAVAASVATVAVLGVQYMYQEDGSVPARQMATISGSGMNTASAPVSPGFNNRDVQTVTQTFEQSPLPAQTNKQIIQQIHRYLIDHNQRASRGAVQGVMPYARIITDPDTGNIVSQQQSQDIEQAQR